MTVAVAMELDAAGRCPVECHFIGLGAVDHAAIGCHEEEAGQKSKKKARRRKPEARHLARRGAGVPGEALRRSPLRGSVIAKKLPAAGQTAQSQARQVPGLGRADRRGRWHILGSGSAGRVKCAEQIDCPAAIHLESLAPTVIPGPADELKVKWRTTSSIDLSWVNGSAPDLQAVAVRRKAGSVAPASLDEGRALSLAGFATSITDTGLRPHHLQLACSWSTSRAAQTDR